MSAVLESVVLYDSEQAVPIVADVEDDNPIDIIRFGELRPEFDKVFPRGSLYQIGPRLKLLRRILVVR